MAGTLIFLVANGQSSLRGFTEFENSEAVVRQALLLGCCQGFADHRVLLSIALEGDAREILTRHRGHQKK